MAPAASRTQRESSHVPPVLIDAQEPALFPFAQASASEATPSSNQKKNATPDAITSPLLSPPPPAASSRARERPRSHHLHHRTSQPPPLPQHQSQRQSQSQSNSQSNRPRSTGGIAAVTSQLSTATVSDSFQPLVSSSTGGFAFSNRTTAGTTTTPTTTNGSTSRERKSSFSVATWMRDPLADVATEVLQKQTTVWLAFQQIVYRAPDAPAMCAYNAVTEETETLTWQELHTQVLSMVSALIHLGLGVGDGVVFCGKSSLSLYVLHMATIAAGGVVCHVRPNWKPEELARNIFPNAKAKILVLESLTENFVRAVRDEGLTGREGPGRSHDVRAIVMLKGYSTERALSLNLPVTLLNMEELRSVAKQCEAADLPLLDRITGAVMPTDCCVIAFDYDAVGAIRGVCLSHDNVMFTAANLARKFGPLTWIDRLVSYLPLHHVASLVLEMFMPLLCGVTVYCAPSYKGAALVSVISNCKPTIFFATPDVWAHISTQVYKAKYNSNSFLYRWAKTRATNNSNKLRFGHEAHRSLGYLIAKKLVLNNFKKKIGLESCVSCYSVLAPLDFELEKLFKTIDIPIYQLYGVAECSGFATINYPHSWEFGTCGRALDGTYLTYNDSSQQLQLIGRHVCLGYVRYHGQIVPTHSAEGKLCIEQQGHLTPDGFLKIIDPPRDFLVLSTGEWVPTAPYEKALREQPELERAVLVGDGRTFLSVMLFMKTANSQANAAAVQAIVNRNSRGTSFSSGSGYQHSAGGGYRSGTSVYRQQGAGSNAVLCEEAIWFGQKLGSKATTVADVIRCQRWAVHFDSVLEQLPRRVGVSGVQVRKWVLMADEFTVDGGELDPDTGEIKRRAVDRKYQALLDSLYS